MGKLWALRILQLFIDLSWSYQNILGVSGGVRVEHIMLRGFVRSSFPKNALKQPKDEDRTKRYAKKWKNLGTSAKSLDGMGIQWNRSTPAFHIWVWASRWLKKWLGTPIYRLPKFSEQRCHCGSQSCGNCIKPWRRWCFVVHVLSEAGESVDFQGIF